MVITTMQLSTYMTPFRVCVLAYKFTGKERDAESGLDYFGARYYSSSMGRFSSPDPSGLYFADQTNLTLTLGGQVGVDAGSTARQFPALEIYRYTTDGTTVTSTLVHNYPETNFFALHQSEKPLAPQAPQ